MDRAYAAAAMAFGRSMCRSRIANCVAILEESDLGDTGKLALIARLRAVEGKRLGWDGARLAQELLGGLPEVVHFPPPRYRRLLKLCRGFLGSLVKSGVARADADGWVVLDQGAP